MPDKQKLKIDDIRKLKITKIKNWAIYFTYNNDRYILHESSKDYETYTTLYKKVPLNESGKFELKWICNDVGRRIPYIHYKCERRIKVYESRTHRQIDLDKFLWDMTWDGFFDSCYSDVIAKRKQQINDIRQAIRILEDQARELRNI
jgi:hypothetical protein